MEFCNPCPPTLLLPISPAAHIRFRLNPTAQSEKQRTRQCNHNSNKQRNLQTSCWRAWLHRASLVEESGDLPGYSLEFLDLAVVGDEVRE